MWKRIEAIQILRDGHSIQFTLRASLLFMIHDLLAYGTLTSLNVHGYHGCPACMFKYFVRHSSKLCKCIYCGNHAYLKMEHPYRRQNSHFNGQEGSREAPLSHSLPPWRRNGTTNPTGMSRCPCTWFPFT